MPSFKYVRVGTELPLIGSDQQRAVLWSRRGLKIQQLESAITSKQEVHLASEYVAILLQRHVHFRLDYPAHLVLILPEVVHHLPECGFFRRVANGPNIGDAQEAEGAVEQLTNARRVQRVEVAFKCYAMDLLNCLVHEQTKEDHC